MSFVELCRAETPDGLLLDGALHLPHKVANPSDGLDAFLLLHGSGSHFYAGGALETFATLAAERGVAALRVNTRGHDGVTRIAARLGPRRGGAAYEDLDECRHDVQGWLTFLERRGMRRVVLVGHSLGGVKAVFAAARDQPATVVAVAAISAPRFRHEALSTRPAFREDFERARELVAVGEGETLLPMREPLPQVMAAAAIVAKYGPHDDYDLIRHLPDVGVPTLYVVGTESVRMSVAFETMPDDLRRVAITQRHVALEIVEGANTVYTGCPEVPFERAWDWLARVLPVR